jgi:hypothetical protein
MMMIAKSVITIANLVALFSEKKDLVTLWLTSH